MCRFFTELLLVLGLLAWPALAQAEWVRDRAPIMGTEVSVELWHADPQQGREAAEAVLDEMRRIEAWLSPWIEDSELSRINREAAGGAVPASSELLGLLERSADFARLSDGAFDITFASAGELYDYRSGDRPDEQARAAVLPAIDYRHVRIDAADGTVAYAHPGVRVDLGGIAKGYAVERCLALLRARGVEHAAVSAGGDSGFLGDRRGRSWIVGIRHPRDREQIVLRMPLRDAAMSTSGDYERYFDEDGTRYHHILDPGTADSARRVVSVTVIGPDATATDALSTTLFVLGVERGLSLIEAQEGFDAVFIDPLGKVHFSSGLAPPDEGG